jgi:hypothetical protein
MEEHGCFETYRVTALGLYRHGAARPGAELMTQYIVYSTMERGRLQLSHGEPRLLREDHIARTSC